MVQILPEPDVELPQAPSGRPPFRKIEGSLSLPEAFATDVQRQAEEMDERLRVLISQMRQNSLPTHRKNGNIFRLLGGGGFRLPASFVMRTKLRMTKL